MDTLFIPGWLITFVIVAILVLSNSRQMFGRQKQSQHWTSLTSVPTQLLN